MKTHPSQSMQQAVEEVLISLGQGGRLIEVKVLTAWPGIVGPQVACHSHPFSLANGVLTVAVHNTVWLGQLNFFRAEMVRKVNEALGREAVSSVRLVLRKKPDWLRRKRAAPVERRDIPAEEEAAIEEACGIISDPSVKESVKRVLRRQAAIAHRR